jgi:Uncharacterized homolog of PSP1
MPLVVGIRFKASGKIYYFDPGVHALAIEDSVIVDTARGQEVGIVAQIPMEMPEEKITPPLRKVLRLATEADKRRSLENQERARKAIIQAVERVAAHKLEMRIIDAEYAFDLTKVILFFIADGRIDFRELVKDLAGIFRTRVELRQIGVRDKAKMVGGLGCCGRPLCCATFLADFEPVSIKMAKEQNLSLNPLKISGVCSRLMCCLKYENEVYKERNREAKAALNEARKQSVAQESETQKLPIVPSKKGPVAPAKKCADCKCDEKQDAEALREQAVLVASQEAPKKQEILSNKARPQGKSFTDRPRRNDRPSKPQEPKRGEFSGVNHSEKAPGNRPQRQILGTERSQNERPVSSQIAKREPNAENQVKKIVAPQEAGNSREFVNNRPRRPERNNHNRFSQNRSNSQNSVTGAEKRASNSNVAQKSGSIQIGMLVKTPEGSGKVINLRTEEQRATVLLDTKNILEFSWNKLEKQ